MANERYQSIRRAIIQPTFGAEPQEQMGVLLKAYSQLAQEVVTCHNRILADEVVITGGAGSVAVTLPQPFPDALYTPLVILDWAAYGRVSAISAAAFTITFSAAAPGGGGIMRLIVIR